MENVDGQHLMLAGQRVDRDFGHGSAIGEIIEGASLMRLPVIGNVGRRIIAGGGKRNAANMRFATQMRKGQPLGARDHAFGGKMHLAVGAAEGAGKEPGQPFADRHRRLIGGHAVQVRTGRGGGGRCIGHLVGARGGDPHPVDRHGKDVGDDLRHLDIQPLPHFRAAMIDLDRPVGIDQHQRAGLIEVRGRKADPELDRG